MNHPKKKHSAKSTEPPKLTMEDLEENEFARNLPQEQKEKLIDFIYDLSLVLYNSYTEEDEKQS